MVVSGTASRLPANSGPELTLNDLALQTKVNEIVDAYGPALLTTSISDLRRMADTPCVADNGANIFGQIWDRYRFVPTAGILRRLGGDASPDLPALIDLMERVWGESASPVGDSVQDVA